MVVLKGRQMGAIRGVRRVRDAAGRRRRVEKIVVAIADATFDILQW